jgi:hypothetical protein
MTTQPPITRPNTFAAGWNACCDREPFDGKQSSDWREGWKKCSRFPAGERVKFNQAGTAE